MAPTGGAVQLPGALLSIKPANLCRPPPSAAAPPASGDSVECALRDALVDSLGQTCGAGEAADELPHGAANPARASAACPTHPTYRSTAAAASAATSLLRLLVSSLRRALHPTQRQARRPQRQGDLQQQLDELPETHPDLKVLVVKSDGAGGGAADRRGFGAVHLTTELTPKVKKLQMQNIPDGCELDVRLPELEHLTVHYFCGDGDAVQGMLDAATKLCTFESYKLWSNNAIAFASNALTDIKLHRSDSLSAIELWAPRLQSLNVQACYWLEEITILESHPLAAELPAGFTPTRFQLYTVNASLTPS
eukprot:jgi/Tetstr1/424864/TSEL_001494.t1